MICCELLFPAKIVNMYLINEVLSVSAHVLDTSLPVVKIM